jgi:hypothetical protein
VKHFIIVTALALACASCNASTQSIQADRAEVSVRKACPAFKTGAFTSDSSRSYGSEQITTFKNASKLNCRCVVKSADQTPSCKQVRRFVLGDIED